MTHAQAEHDAGPVDAHGVVLKVPHGAPQVGVILRREVVVDARHHAAPAAGFDQPDDGNQQRAQPDQHELQHLVEDRREQPAQAPRRPPP